MKGRKILPVGLALVLFSWINAFARPDLQERKAEAVSQKKAEQTSFIKKEKLPVLEPSLAAAKRDLFRISYEAPVADIPSGGLEGQDIQEELNKEAPVSLLQKVDIVYLGMVFSGKKKVALLELDGQPLSLSEGEELLPGLRLVAIGSEELLIKDSENNSRKVRLKES